MTISRGSSVFGSVVLALVVSCSACSSSPSAPSGATVAQKFQAIVTSTDKALTRDQKAKPEAQSFAKYAADFHRAAVQIGALRFPASARHAATALVSALDTLSRDAATTATAAEKPQDVSSNVLAMAKANLSLMEEEKTELSVSNTLRRALGLPVVTSTTVPPPTTQPAAVTTSPAG